MESALESFNLEIERTFRKIRNQKAKEANASRYLKFDSEDEEQIDEEEVDGETIKLTNVEEIVERDDKALRDYVALTLNGNV